MKKIMAIGLVLAMCAAVNVRAEELKSGLQPGQFIGAFYVTKCAGAEDDGVAVGANLCYRCKYGGRPQIMVFTKSTDKEMAKLVKSLDDAIAKNSAKQLRVFINVLGEDKATAQQEAEKFAKSAGTKRVPIVVPNESENGPADYGLNPAAETTIIMAAGGQVKANHAFAKGKIDAKSVLADIAKILN